MTETDKTDNEMSEEKRKANEEYKKQQTPFALAKLLIDKIPLEVGDVVYEPFKGEGNFYNQFPETIHKDWSEIREGRNFLTYIKPVDWVITYPPFKMDSLKGKDSVFFRILNYFASENRVRKGICLLASKESYMSITPRRMNLLNSKGWYLKKQVVCNVVDCRGRMVFMMFGKKEIKYEEPVFDYLLKFF